jgi:hypothetical protein
MSVFLLDTLVVIAGGDGGAGGGGGYVEIFSNKNNVFTKGPALPYPLVHAASVPFGDSFVIVGGQRYNPGWELSTGKSSYNAPSHQLRIMQ